jgi:hypothetical protein
MDLEGPRRFSALASPSAEPDIELSGERQSAEGEVTHSEGVQSFTPPPPPLGGGYIALSVGKAHWTGLVETAIN